MVMLPLVHGGARADVVHGLAGRSPCGKGVRVLFLLRRHLYHGATCAMP
jgi:hypothetical protein